LFSFYLGLPILQSCFPFQSFDQLLLVAGAGSITSLLSLKAEYETVNILIALIVNLIIVYIVLKATKLIEKALGETGIHILRKIFGIILLAISVKLFLTNTGINIPTNA